MKKEYLPIGSVVLLKGATKRIMINGFYAKNESNEVFDYMGVLYPEGHIGEQFQYMFNHEDIAEIVFRGFEDEERTQFLSMLSDLYEKK